MLGIASCLLLQAPLQLSRSVSVSQVRTRTRSCFFVAPADLLVCSAKVEQLRFCAMCMLIGYMALYSLLRRSDSSFRLQMANVTFLTLLLYADGEMLSNKEHGELIEKYEVRCDAVRSFVQAAHPGIECRTVALRNASQPTPADLEADITALVASEETLKGATKINEGRLQQGMSALVLVLVPVLGAASSAAGKLSSTFLRAQEVQ